MSEWRNLLLDFQQQIIRVQLPTRLGGFNVHYMYANSFDYDVIRRPTDFEDAYSCVLHASMFACSPREATWARIKIVVWISLLSWPTCHRLQAKLFKNVHIVIPIRRNLQNV